MLRMIVSPTRSGSTALLRCFENNPYVARVYHQPVKSGYRQDGTFDYSFFQLDNPDLILVAKETVGGFELPETTFSPIPASLDTLRREAFAPSEQGANLRLLALFRDPLQTWASIERLNIYSAGISPYYSPFKYFVTSFEAVFSFLTEARRLGINIRVITQEMLAAQPVVILKTICKLWEIPWSPAMVAWTHPYGAKTWFSDEARFRMDHDPRFMKSKEALAASNSYRYVPSTTEFVAPEHRVEIRYQLNPLYAAITKMALQDFPEGGVVPMATGSDVA